MDHRAARIFLINRFDLARLELVLDSGVLRHGVAIVQVAISTLVSVNLLQASSSTQLAVDRTLCSLQISCQSVVVVCHLLLRCGCPCRGHLLLHLATVLQQIAESDLETALMEILHGVTLREAPSTTSVASRKAWLD